MQPYESVQKIETNNPDQLMALFGTHDRHVRIIEEATGVRILNRGAVVEIAGESAKVAQVVQLMEQLLSLAASGHSLQEADVVTGLKLLERNGLDHMEALYTEEIGRLYVGKPIFAKTFGQRQYVRAIDRQSIVFGIGPAGTGKTFLAVVKAVTALKQGRIKKLVLTRPAVEAGENLGFLPGDLKEKVDPYLRPIYDALHAVLGTEHTMRLMDRGVIEIAPLAYMRGRTLDEAFVILDEAQNTTPAQMKMFLTRLGYGSQMVVNGDISQIDLPRGMTSGLIDARNKLHHVSGVSFVVFDAHDVVRHPLVAEIIQAYDQSNQA